KVALPRPFDAVGAGAEIDAVEIKLENLRLAEFVLKPERERQLLQLARNRALLGQEQILGELLGNGRAALRRATPEHVVDDGAHDPPRIDAVMRMEAPVLDRDERLGHVVRQFAQRYRGAAHVAARRERRPVEPEDKDRRRSLGNFERLDRRQMNPDPDEDADSTDGRPQREHDAPIKAAADQRTALAATTTAAAPSAFAGFARRRGRAPRAQNAPPPPRPARGRAAAPGPRTPPPPLRRAAGAVLRAQPQVEACVVATTLAAGPSQRHVSVPALKTRSGRRSGAGF